MAIMRETSQNVMLDVLKKMLVGHWSIHCPDNGYRLLCYCQALLAFSHPCICNCQWGKNPSMTYNPMRRIDGQCFFEMVNGLLRIACHEGILSHKLKPTT